ncbi:MAG: hypothetical protein ACRCWC_11985, partial [Plesiomonas shigelloides]
AADLSGFFFGASSAHQARFPNTLWYLFSRRYRAFLHRDSVNILLSNAILLVKAAILNTILLRC